MFNIHESLLLPQSRWMRLLVIGVAVALGVAAALVNQVIASALVVVMLIIGGFTAAGTAMKVEWGLFGFIFMSYTRFSDVIVDHGAPSIAQPFLALLFLIIFMRWMLYREKAGPWVTPAILVIIYGMIGLASMIYAKNTDLVKEGVVAYFKDVIIVVLLVMLIRSKANLRLAIWGLIAAGIFMGTLTTFQQLTGTYDNDYFGFAKAGKMQIVGGQADDYRIAGPIGDPNFYSQVLLTLIPLGLERFWNEKHKYLRYAALWQVAVCLASIFFSFSRGAILAISVSMLFMFIRRPPKPLHLLVMIGLFIPLLQILPPSYAARLETIPQAIPGLSSKDVRTEASFRGRSSAQQAGIKMFFDHPIFGLGVGNFPVHYQEYSRSLGLDATSWEQAPHNMYLEILTETGLVGLTFFLFMLWFMLRGMNQAQRIFKQRGLKDYADLVYAFQAGLVGYMIAGIFLHLAYPRFFWVLIGIGFAMNNVAQKVRQEEHQEELTLGQRIKLELEQAGAQ